MENFNFDAVAVLKNIVKFPWKHLGICCRPPTIRLQPQRRFPRNFARTSESVLKQILGHFQNTFE